MNAPSCRIPCARTQVNKCIYSSTKLLICIFLQQSGKIICSYGPLVHIICSYRPSVQTIPINEKMERTEKEVRSPLWLWW